MNTLKHLALAAAQPGEPLVLDRRRRVGPPDLHQLVQQTAEHARRDVGVAAEHRLERGPERLAAVRADLDVAVGARGQQLEQAYAVGLGRHHQAELAGVPDGRGREAYLGLKKLGILVRHFERPGLADKIRITIGTMQQNNALLAGIKTLAAAGADPAPAKPNGKAERTAEKAADKSAADKPERAEKADRPEKADKPDRVEKGEAAA